MTDEILHRLPQAAKPDDDPIVTGMRIGNAILHAVHRDSVAYGARTVGDFLAALRALGVRETDPLGSIEFGISQQGTKFIRAERDADGVIDIHELSRSEIK